MMERKINWTTTRGAKVEALLKYEATYIPSRPVDGGWEGITRETYLEERSIDIYINGELFGTIKGNISEVMKGKNYPDQDLVKGGCTIKGNMDKANGEKVRFGTDGVTYDRFVQEWRILEAQAPKDVNRLKSREAELDIYSEVIEAKRIIEDAETSVVNISGKLMTVAEARVWRKKYNDFYNEGGEGYIPDVVTKEAYEWAKAILSR
jgi:hypothetical protein